MAKTTKHAIHPGKILREQTLPTFGISKNKAARGISKNKAARLLGISRYRLANVLNERSRVKPDFALRIGKLSGTGPEIWLGLQREHDLENAERLLAKEIKRIPTLEAAE